MKKFIKKNHVLYQTWKSMIARCYYKTSTNYGRYGARGITVSDEFRYSFETFVDYVTSLSLYKKRIHKKLTLDRIDASKGYERGNLRWASRLQQVMNRNIVKDSSNLIGKKFNRLTITHIFYRNGKGVCMAECLCSCGRVTVKKVHDLKLNLTKSCGCLNFEIRPNLVKSVTKHGMSKTGTYSSWKGMRKHSKDKICSSWDKFENFLKDMGKKPHHTLLMRKDFTKKFTKNNCYWKKIK